jgi:Tol biopolymer transport system component
VDRISGKPHIWRMDLNGDDPKQLPNGDGEHVPDCCVDGKWIVYSSLGGNGTKLWRVDLEGRSRSRSPTLSAGSRSFLRIPSLSR